MLTAAPANARLISASCRVASDSSAVVRVSQMVTQQADLRAGHRDEYRVGALQAAGHETQHRVQVFGRAAVEHRGVLELLREDGCRLTHRWPPGRASRRAG